MILYDRKFYEFQCEECGTYSGELLDVKNSQTVVIYCKGCGSKYYLTVETKFIVTECEKDETKAFKQYK